MASCFHVFNSDSTRMQFEKSTLEGNFAVWREMCCEGKLSPIIDSDDFWKKRYSFFEKEFGVAKLDYYDQTIKELLKITEIPKENEVVLWFEYDLFCQVNLLAACTLLLQHYRKDLTYYLICVGYRKGTGKLVTLSDFSPEELKYLYENKVKITRNDLEFAKTCWGVYVSGDTAEIRAFKFSNSKKFKYLKKAMEYELLRRPDAMGLSNIDRKILELIKENPLTVEEIVRELLSWQNTETWYGFGDLQYFSYIKRLKKYYYIKNDRYFLTDTGKSLIEKS